MAGITQFIRYVDPNREATKALHKDVKDITATLETAIKQRTPVRTGRLKTSIEGRMVGFLQGEVGTNVDYASHVEFGTSRMSPRAMFRKGGEAVRKLGTRALKNTGKLL